MILSAQRLPTLELVMIVQSYTECKAEGLIPCSARGREGGGGVPVRRHTAVYPSVSTYISEARGPYFSRAPGKAPSRPAPAITECYRLSSRIPRLLPLLPPPPRHLPVPPPTGPAPPTAPDLLLRKHVLHTTPTVLFKFIAFCLL